MQLHICRSDEMKCKFSLFAFSLAGTKFAAHKYIFIISQLFSMLWLLCHNSICMPWSIFYGTQFNIVLKVSIPGRRKKKHFLLILCAVDVFMCSEWEIRFMVNEEVDEELRLEAGWKVEQI